MQPQLCDHVHLPVQSGSTRVLDAMQRLYTREQYLERIAWMKAARREISITTDMIVGFPGETEEDFEETLSLLDEVQSMTPCSHSSIRRVRTRRRLAWKTRSRKKRKRGDWRS